MLQGIMAGFHWMSKHVRHAADEFMKDLSSLKAIWNWIFLSFYIALCTYIAFVNKAAHSTIVTVTGGVVTAIFAGYIYASTVEKKEKIGKHAPKQGDGDPNGA